MPAPLFSPQEFAELLLEEQFACIDEHLNATTLEPLLSVCEELADTGPLVHLARRCVERNLPLPGGNLLRFGSLGLQAVLELPGFEQPAAEAWSLAKLPDLVSFCLLDRYLRRRAPETWESLRSAAESAAEQCLRDQQAPEDGVLLRLPGSSYARLAVEYPGGWAAWQGSWRAAARSALKLLAERPRDVSQANAERLLSSQVYTDPGHFLLELLQNADDAGATCFTVEFEPSRITVRHNGAPFDFRDVVGLLSVGQTTKKSTQIGYFGVGFKSIYEVTDRPRLRSGHFCLEIADISVPRPLAEFGNETETTLVLPLTAGTHVEQLWQRALAVDATLLLQLPHLRRVDWRKNHDEVCLSLENLGGDEYQLRHGAESRRYLLWSGLYQHAGARPVGKASVARVLLALPLDEQPLGSSLYSFLPIAESSGLRFVVGSHFDVPVDRERLDSASEWNRGLIDFIPRLLSERFAADPDAAWRLLPILPLAEDPLGPLFAQLPDALAGGLHEVPLVPGGKRASQVRVFDPAVEPLFDEERPYATERQRAWLVRLGAQVYDREALLNDLQRGVLPGRLAQRQPADWSVLHRILAGESGLDRLRLLPLLLDREAQPASAVEVTVLLSEWETLFEQPPRAVHPELVSQPDSAGLLARLGVSAFGWKELSTRLHFTGASGIRLPRLYELLLDAPQGTALGILELPLFPDADGTLESIATPATYRHGLVAAHRLVPQQLFPWMRFLAPEPAVERLLESLGWPRLDLPGALDALKEQALRPEGCERLLEAVEAWEGSLHSGQLLALRLFEGSDGQRYQLRELWRFHPESLGDLLSHLPSLQDESASARVVGKLGLQHQMREGNLDTLLAEMPRLNPQIALVYLAAHAWQLSRTQIDRLFAMPIFEGNLLGPTGVQAARVDYVDSLQALGVRVLSAEWTRMLELLLQVGGVRPLGLARLVEALKTVPPSAELLPLLRRPLLADREELELTLSQEARQELPVWLCLDGCVRAARDVPPTDEIAQLTGRADGRPAPGQAEWLELFPLLEPVEFLTRVVDREARLGRRLHEQPAWLNSLESVDRVATHLRKPLQVDAQTRLRDTSLYYASALAYPMLQRSHFRDELLHPQSAPEQRHHASLLPPSFVLETFVSVREDQDLRGSFYAYVEGELASIVSDPEGRRLLAELPLWRSTGLAWKSLSQLVLDPDLPADVGDWTPDSEVPRDLLERAQSVLGVGRPDPETMLREHLLPAYLRGRSREKLLGVMARMATGLPPATLRRVLRPPDGTGSFPLPGGGDLQTAYAPPEEAPALPSLPPVGGDFVPFLRRLGLAYLPSSAALRQLGERLTGGDGDALLHLVEWAWQNSPEALDSLGESLAELRWLPNRNGMLKLPRQLFGRSSELKELIGNSPELFAARRLPAALARRLGLKDENDVDGELVIAHLRSQVQRGQRVSSRLYRFLDAGLVEGRISPAYLRDALRGANWIWTDEGEYRAPAHVLGFPAFRYFGAQRGTWEGVHQRFPALARLFAIPAELSAEVVVQFLQELRLQPPAEGTTRLLRACLAFLGDQDDARFPREWRVIPARQAGAGTTLLLAAHTPGLVRSNSPTLEALFARAGRLYVAEAGEPALDRLYERLGIPRLRDAYTVTPDGSGRDVSEEQRERLAAFRPLLRALHAVVPRLRAARPELEEGEWLAETRLRHFGSSGPIRVLEDLALAYELPGVGRVRVEAAAAFHPERNELLLSVDALMRPDRHAVALAEGLLDCVYQGPGADGLLDLLNLLIPLLDREAMDGYLDRRHFPRPFVPEDNPETRVRDRLGEFLDFGLQRLLEQRFAELAGADWKRWRSGDKLPVGSLALLRLLGLPNPSAELVEELSGMLDAPSLEAWSSSLVEPVAPAAYAASPALEAAARPAAAAAPVAAQPPTSLAGKMLERFSQWLGGGQATALHHNVESIGDLAETYRHPPERHLLVSTRALQGSDLYCLNFLGVNFDARRQMYVPGPVPWSDSFAPSGRTVDFSGRLSVPDGVVPMPMGSRFSRPPRLALQGPGSFGEFRSSGADVEMSYSVELSKQPDYRVDKGLRSFEPHLVRPTAPDSALPKLVHEWIAWARGADLLPWQLAERARDFVIAHYLYDLKFLDDPELRAFAQRPAAGDNRALALLHQGASGRYLGRGVCMELSALLLEMLRRAGIPCVLASVWALDLGLIHRPDHAIVLVYLATQRGACWIPVDPSHNRLESHKPEEASRADLLQTAVDLVFGPSFAVPSQGVERERVHEAALVERLGSQRRLEVLLEFIAGSRYVRELDGDLRWLVDQGWLRVGQEQLYRVWTDT